MEISVKNKRATLFCSLPIQFNEEMIKVYMNEFSPKDLIPTVNKGMGLKITPKGLIAEDVISLELKKLDDSRRVVFSSDRIDIESNQTDDAMEDFLLFANDIKQVLSDKMNVSFNRLALCESVVFTISDAQRMEAYKTIVNKEEAIPVEWQFQNVRRSKITVEPQPACDVTINEVYNVKSPENPDVNIMVLDMDINTKVGTPSEQIKAVEPLFWSYANNIISSTVDSYKKRLENANE